MNSRNGGLAVAAVALLVLAGCASRGYEQSESAAESIRGASGAIDRFNKSSEEMLASLNALLGEPRDDSPAKFNAFSGKVDSLASADGTQRSALLGMRADADARFKAWEMELAQYKSPDMREKSEDRLKKVRSGFEKAAKEADAVLEPAAALTADTQDLKRLLANDLTPAGLDTAASAAKKIRSGCGRVDKVSKDAMEALEAAAEALAAAKKEQAPPK